MKKSKNQKTTRQKRVLIASVLVAGVITVGGTFAWFTSTDDVTNRLSANSAYNVQITESFTPPDSWMPGQEVNKDMSAVNTGNYDAFVKIGLSNSLSLTRLDTPDAVFSDAKKDSYVKLSDTEVTAIQAGGYIEYSPVSGEIGNAGTDFTPTSAGIHIFRRSISGTPETYEYAGYYYDLTDFYAVTGLSVTGGVPAYKVEKTKKETVEPTMTFDGTAKKITAVYGTGDNKITININLAADFADNWTADESTNTFYYKQILAAGVVSHKLVDSVTLDEGVKNDAYIHFDYDLNASLESIQASGDTDKTTAVNAAGWDKTASVSGTAVTWTVRA